MVELTLHPLDAIFGSLADPTRRDILKRVAKAEMSIGEIAKHYQMTFAAVSKHLQILERAKLIIKRRKGKEQMVRLYPDTIKDASEFLKTYEKLWNDRLDALDQYLATFPPDKRTSTHS